MSKRILIDLPPDLKAEIASRQAKGDRDNTRVALASKATREDSRAWRTYLENLAAEIYHALADVNKAYDKLARADPYIFQSLMHERFPRLIRTRVEESQQLQLATAEERGDHVLKVLPKSVESLEAFISRAEDSIDYESAIAGMHEPDDSPEDIPATVPDSLANPDPEENSKFLWPRFALAVKAYKTVALSASALAKVITMYKCYSLAFSVGGNGRISDIFGNTRSQSILSDAAIEKVVRKHLTQVGVQLPTAGGKRKPTQSGSKSSVGAPRHQRKALK